MPTFLGIPNYSVNIACKRYTITKVFKAFFHFDVTVKAVLDELQMVHSQVPGMCGRLCARG